MTDPTTAFSRAWAEVTKIVAATPDLAGFAGWPQAAPSPRPANRVPAADILKGWTDGLDPAMADLHHAIRGIADHADWQLTYSEDEVGRDFLNRYGWFELVGPNGHFRSDTVAAFIAYWGSGLYYSWHLHEAEELYFIVSGRATFEAEGEAARDLGPGETRFHRRNQPHAMTTTDSPVLALILWRGPGLAGDPRMGTS